MFYKNGGDYGCGFIQVGGLRFDLIQDPRYEKELGFALANAKDDCGSNYVVEWSAGIKKATQIDYEVFKPIDGNPYLVTDYNSMVARWDEAGCVEFVGCLNAFMRFDWQKSLSGQTLKWFEKAKYDHNNHSSCIGKDISEEINAAIKNADLSTFNFRKWTEEEVMLIKLHR